MKHVQHTAKKRPSSIRALPIILALILGAGVLLLGVYFIAPLTERVDPTPVEGSADWMRRLDDARPVNELILPGTHSSAARTTERAFFTKCQALSVAEQLDAGFRLLDLRLVANEYGDGFLLACEGSVCKSGGAALTLDVVLRDCYAFLEQHPTETVLVSVQNGDETMSTHAFQFLLDAYIREAPHYWALCETLPTLGDVRGRLVLLRGCEDAAGLGAEAGLPFVWKDQGGAEDPTLDAVAENNGSYLLYVQDRYEYDVDDKWDAFLSGRRGVSEGAVSLNFLSTKGDTAYGHPYEYAKKLNERLLDAEDGELGGWILVDFGSATLAERIYRLNR